MLLEHFSRNAKVGQLTRERIRRTGVVGKGSMVWRQPEDDVVRQLFPDYRRLMKALPNRTYYSLRNRARLLGLVTRKIPWTGSQVSRLRRLYPRMNGQQLLSEFPGFSLCRIRSKAKLLHICGPKVVFCNTGFPILDDIRKRAQDLNYSMVDLDDIAHTGTYFQKAGWFGKKTFDAECARKAVEAMDGELKAEWNESIETNAVALRPDLRPAA